MKARFIVIVSLCAAVCGCGTVVRNLYGPHHTVRDSHTSRDAPASAHVPSQGKAMLVASLTAENLDFHRRALVSLPIYKGDGRKNEPIVLRISNGIPQPESGRKSDFPDVQGKLFSIELAPGAYQLWPFVAYDQEYFVSLSKASYWGFTLQPGEVLYLGNFHFGLVEGQHLFSNLGGPPNIEKVKFELREQFERDSQVLLRRYPALQASSINRNGPKALSWSAAKQINDTTKSQRLPFPGGGILGGPF
ncbi:MAG: hypothetical protein AABY95_08380 [Pseudomonadota bacterium]